MRKVAALVFDVDGVLLDSLGPHLRICRDLSARWGLGVSVPGEDEFRELVRAGATISPMEEFFATVGFPKGEIARAVEEYRRSFMREYGPRVFPGVVRALEQMHAAGVRMGIVTSNFRVNVEGALGEGMRVFDPALIYTVESAGGHPKAGALRRIVAKVGRPAGECVYVGDQPADEQAAREAGMTFLGVTYGWGITAGEEGFPVVGSLEELAREVWAQRGAGR